MLKSILHHTLNITMEYGNVNESYNTANNYTNNEMKINILSYIEQIVTSSSYIKHPLPPPPAPL